MRFKPFIALLAMLFGFLGVAACGVGTVFAWSAFVRLSRANEKLFNQIDESLGTVQVRVLDAQRRVQASKITTEDIQQNLKDWTRKKSSEQIASRLAISENTEALSQGLHQADVWLELSGTTFQNVRQALELGSSLGVPVDTELADALIEKLTNLRSKLSQATETVDGINERVDELSDGDSREERREQAVQLTLRAIATLSEIDTRLGESANGLTESQAKGKQLQSRTHTYIVAAQIGVVGLMVWMAVGQYCLLRYGWQAYRQPTSTAGLAGGPR